MRLKKLDLSDRSRISVAEVKISSTGRKIRIVGTAVLVANDRAHNCKITGNIEVQ